MQVFQRVYGLQTVVLRYFNVFGPRQDAYSQYSAVLARFISAMLQGENPVVYGDGEQSRDFTYIDNVVAANLLACSAPADRASGRVFNIATGDQTTLNQVIRSLKRITGYDGPVVHAPARAGDIRHSLADISRARDDLGYRLGVGFEEGLERTVGWYRKQLNEPVAKRG
jgi:UDP-glucose 4-epimerase